MANIDRDGVSLVVVGAGESLYTSKLKQIAGDRIVLKEPQPFDDVPKWVSIADLVAVPQDTVEGIHGQIPAKVIDAMAMKVPVISTPVSDLPEILDGCGVLIEEAESSLLRDAIVDLIESPSRRKQLGKKDDSDFLKIIVSTHMSQ